ncbi:beat protein [Holotrichia oblita]|uniref:Beat protein n=1 Tax=Holotrichia oblita TaxID=644536 RepID=A0ACB9TAK0_HOLOL|nr:beat protein [Holotrichia oblita]
MSDNYYSNDENMNMLRLYIRYNDNSSEACMMYQAMYPERRHPHPRTLTRLEMHGSLGLRLTNMSSPIVADLRDELKLDCLFDMGGEQLYAVKWYKDDQEFFRYMPGQTPATITFPVAGVHLVTSATDCGHDHCKVRLHGLTRDHSGGAYRCEISSEAPTFRLASETHNVTIAALPKGELRIEGLAPEYLEGEPVNVDCVSELADPAPILSWYINGHQELMRVLTTCGNLHAKFPKLNGNINFMTLEDSGLVKGLLFMAQ